MEAMDDYKQPYQNIQIFTKILPDFGSRDDFRSGA